MCGGRCCQSTTRWLPPSAVMQIPTRRSPLARAIRTKILMMLRSWRKNRLRLCSDVLLARAVRPQAVAEAVVAAANLPRLAEGAAAATWGGNMAANLPTITQGAAAAAARQQTVAEGVAAEGAAAAVRPRARTKEVRSRHNIWTLTSVPLTAEQRGSRKQRMVNSVILKERWRMLKSYFLLTKSSSWAMARSSGKTC